MCDSATPRSDPAPVEAVFYLKDKLSGAQTSLKTSDKHEATRLLAAKNESESQPAMNLGLARVYMNGADPKLLTRTWQEVMEGIVAQKTDETRRRWEVAIKDPIAGFESNHPHAGVFCEGQQQAFPPHPGADKARKLLPHGCDIAPWVRSTAGGRHEIKPLTPRAVFIALPKQFRRDESCARHVPRSHVFQPGHGLHG